MYLQSATILNYHGIRRLKINFEPTTSALIGENAWGKSSLLSALWLALGQGTDHLGILSENDVYVPVRLGDAPAAHDGKSPVANETSDASCTSDDLQGQKPYRTVRLKDKERCYYSLRTPSGNRILKIVDRPLEDVRRVQDPSRTAGSEKLKSAKGSFHNQALDDFINKHKKSSGAYHKGPGIFERLSSSQQQEAEYELDRQGMKGQPDPSELLSRVKAHLDCADELDAGEKSMSKEDLEFYSADTYCDTAERTVIDLVFCENTKGELAESRRMSLLRTFAYSGEDALMRLRYRITGMKASVFTQNLSMEQTVQALNSGTVLMYPNKNDASESTLHEERKSVHSVNAFDASDRSDLFRLLTSSKESIKLHDSFLTIHELLDGKGRHLPKAIGAIRDLITLNPLLRLRDRRMLKSTAPDSAELKNAMQKSPEIDGFRTVFSAIGSEDDLNATALNRGLNELNVIASKYLVTYSSNVYLKKRSGAGDTLRRTARDIVSHPVSIETLNSLKEALEDERPSRAKLLLSLLAGAILMNNPSGEIDPYSKPILVLEDIEGRFHPTLLLTLWSILETIPVQKIVTTNSSSLLSVMPLHNLRRLCRLYYDVRCHSIDSAAFSTDDERRIAFHIRINRPDALFARCWILVEGETEVWMLNEIAGILGFSPGCAGVKTIEFAQCGLAPLIKLARQLGISYYVLTDGDDAGHRYATTVQSFTGRQHISDHLSVIPHSDIEHYFYVSGYADVYQKAAGLQLQRPIKRKSAHVATDAEAAWHKESRALKEAFETLKAFTEEEVKRAAAAARNMSRLINSLQQRKEKGDAEQHDAGRHDAEPLKDLTREMSFVMQMLRKYDGLTKQGDTSNSGKGGEFDVRNVTAPEIRSFYENEVRNLRNSGTDKEKLTAKQKRAAQRLRNEESELLYCLGLDSRAPASSALRSAVKNRKPGTLIPVRRKGKTDRIRCDFMFPKFLYNSLKKKHERRALSARDTECEVPDLTVRPGPGDLESLKSIQKRLNAMLYQLRLQKQLYEDSLYQTARQDDPSETDQESRSCGTGAEERSREIFDEAVQRIVTSNADPLDEARILKKARQQAGIDYASIGAMDQATLKKQGWTIDKVIDAAIHKKSKPGLAILVMERMQQRGPDGVPQMFRTMFMKIKRIAGDGVSI